MGWTSPTHPFGAARLLCGEVAFTAPGMCATAIGLAIVTGAAGTFSQLRRLLSSGVRPRIRPEFVMLQVVPAGAMRAS